MSDYRVLNAQKRTEFGTGASRALRNKGLIPAIIYGNKKEHMHVAIEAKEINKFYQSSRFSTTLIEIHMDGKKYKVLPREVELNPITDLVRHVDFMFIADKGHQKINVPIEYAGKDKAAGVKRGGFFNIISRKIPLNCPVNNIPREVKIDVTKMQVGSSLPASSITLPEGCSIASKKNIILASITGRGRKAAAEEGEEAQTQEG